MREKNQREKHKKKKIKRREKEISEGNRIQQRLNKKRIKQLLKTAVPSLEIILHYFCNFYVITVRNLFHS